MKTKLAMAMTSALFLVLFCGVVLRAQDKPANVAGDWNVTLTTPMGDLMLTLTMQQEAEHIKGTLKGGPNGDTPIEGTMKGNDMDFQVDAGGFSVDFTGTVSGDAITGKASGGNFAFDWKAARAK